MSRITRHALTPNPALRELIELLAQIAVDQFWSEREQPDDISEEKREEV